jgi:hypothetical protein
VLPYDDPATRERLAAILGGPSVRTAALLTTKNQLEATMSMLAARDRTDRRERVARSLDLTCEEIFTIYGPTADDPDDLFANPRLVRLLGGQGLAAPARADLNRVLFPLRVADRVRLEREIAAQTGCAHRIGELVPGRVLRVEDGEVRDAGPAPSIAVLDREEDRKFAPDLERFADFPLAPLRDEARDRDAQERRILDYVERRFLPHLVGARNPPVERLLAEGGGEWRIRIRYGTRASHEDRDLVLTFARPRFEPAPAAGPPGEHLFANDVEDVLDGRADEFSTFCRAPLPAPTQHLWLSLGLPWLNPDLVERKLRFHFDRVARGETNEDFVTPFWRWS